MFHTPLIKSFNLPDSNNVQFFQDQDKGSKGSQEFMHAPIAITDAMLMGSVCKKCGGRGHLVSNVGGKVGSRIQRFAFSIPKPVVIFCRCG